MEKQHLSSYTNAMQEQYNKVLYGDDQMQAAGRELAQHLLSSKALAGSIITLSGELGAGKTTFSRGFVQACGYVGAVKSPTYTLIERYTTELAEICHLDLYRLEDPEELDFIGFRDLLEADSTLLIEWPERVPAMADLATIKIIIGHRDAESRQLQILAKNSL